MLFFLNNLGVADDRVVYGHGLELTKGALLRIEWMLREWFKSAEPGRDTVIKWINDNWEKHRVTFSSLHPTGSMNCPHTSRSSPIKANSSADGGSLMSTQRVDTSGIAPPCLIS